MSVGEAFPRHGWWIPILMISVGINVGLLLGKIPWVGGSQGSPPTAVEDGAGAGVDPSHRQADPSPAAERGSELPRRLRRAVMRMADDLGLQGESRREFIGLQETFFRRSMKGRDRLRKARQELRRELTAREPAKEEAEHWVAELAAAQGDLEGAFIDNYFATRLLLGPEQEPKFRRFMGRIREVRQELLEIAARHEKALGKRRRARP